MSAIPKHIETLDLIADELGVLRAEKRPWSTEIQQAYGHLRAASDLLKTSEAKRVLPATSG